MFFKEDMQTATWAELRGPGWVILLRQADRQRVSGSHSQGLPLASVWTQSCSDTVAQLWTPELGAGSMVLLARSQKELVPFLPPRPSGPYPTFWIPWRGQLCKGALSPRERKVTRGRATWEPAGCARSWGWDGFCEQEGSRLQFHGVTFFF